jgi:hypothetical protein
VEAFENAKRGSVAAVCVAPYLATAHIPGC